MTQNQKEIIMTATGYSSSIPTTPISDEDWIAQTNKNIAIVNLHHIQVKESRYIKPHYNFRMWLYHVFRWALA